MSKKDTIFLFDVCGTLTESRSLITPKMVEMLTNLKKKVTIGYIGGSDLTKQKEQFGPAIDIFDYKFPENGVQCYKDNVLTSSDNILNYIDDDVYNRFINFSLKYLGNLDIPKKRGTFIELRKSLINISPIGRNCDKNERKEFSDYDNKNLIRRKMIDALDLEFKGLFCYTIGGQISFDCFLSGWDKSYALKHLSEFENIVFFGDMTDEGGNDHAIFVHERTKGIKVSGPDDTYCKVIQELSNFI